MWCYTIVTPRKGRVSRNLTANGYPTTIQVTPRKGRVSRNSFARINLVGVGVTPRKGRVSRNSESISLPPCNWQVTPRKGRVSRNLRHQLFSLRKSSHASQGACE